MNINFMCRPAVLPV